MADGVSYSTNHKEMAFANFVYDFLYMTLSFLRTQSYNLTQLGEKLECVVY